MWSRAAALLLLAVPSVHAQERAHCSDTEREAYVQAISQAVFAAWKVPKRNYTLECTVLIKQNFRGEVLNVGIAKCGDDREVHKSVINAGYLASPVPMPDNKACFMRDVIIRITARTQESG